MRTKSAAYAEAVLAAAILALGPPVFAGAPPCGDSLAPGSVTTLTANVECSPVPGVFTLDSATLNLNGFTITCLNEESGTHGIRLIGKKSVVTGPGSIIGCDPGVLAIGEGKHLVDGIQVDSVEGVGVVLLSDKNTVSNITATGQDGIRPFGDKNRIVDNVVSAFRLGIDVYGGRNKIISNELSSNVDAVVLRGSKNQAAENTLTGPQNGFTIEGEGHKVSGNTVTSAVDFGMRVYGEARILQNTVTGCGVSGIDVYSAADADVKISGNEATGNARDLFDSTADCGEHKWSGNTFETAIPASCIE